MECLPESIILHIISWMPYHGWKKITCDVQPEIQFLLDMSYAMLDGDHISLIISIDIQSKLSLLHDM